LTNIERSSPDRRPESAAAPTPRVLGRVIALTILGSCALANRVVPQEEGRAAYERACASCHGVDARGGGPVAPALRTPPSDLTVLAARHGGTFPRDDVVAVVTGARDVTAHGQREMPIWNVRFGPGIGRVPGAYAQRRLDLLVDYVAALQRTP
jgi:mono/diheme cytochrome c family protein